MSASADQREEPWRAFVSTGVVLDQQEGAIVCAYYAQRPAAKGKIDLTTAKKLRRALREWGFSTGDVQDAVRGLLGDEWAQATGNLSLKYLLRDSAHVEKYRAMAGAQEEESLVGKPTYEPDGITLTRWGRIALGLERAS